MGSSSATRRSSQVGGFLGVLLKGGSLAGVLNRSPMLGVSQEDLSEYAQTPNPKPQTLRQPRALAQD